MSLRWFVFTSILTLLFTTSGIWLESRLRPQPVAHAEVSAAQQSGLDTTQSTLQILVTGAVQNPGMYRLPAGSNIQDLISAAGGAESSARLSSINLSQVLSAGQVIHIPAIANPDAQTSPDQNSDSNKESTEEKTKTAIKKTSKANKSSSHKVAINQATQSQIEELNGVGPTLAKRILEWRQRNGKFQSIQDLLKVKGIGQKKLEKFQHQIEL